MVVPSAMAGLKSLSGPLIQPLFLPMLYLTLQSLGTILNVWQNKDRLQDERNLFRESRESKAYDFIIVGAGSSGSLLANRLSLQYRVLLLEAGGEPNFLQFIPGFALFLINQPVLDWQYRSVPQKYGSLMSVNGESSWSAGFGLGGTGNLNLMIHLRGHTRDFDNWAKITGDPSWSWEGVLPHFRSYEEYEIPGDNINHGYKGDLRVEAPNHIGRAWEFVKAGMEMGYPNVDLNAPFVEGFDVLRYPLRRGVRQAPFKAFLEPIRHRNSLTIMKFAQVNRVLFSEGGVAYGVEYDRHGRTYTAHATKEIILSAGTVGTSKILMLSGVGPKSHLQSLNIPVVSDLPVGENLQDHLGVYLGPFFIREGLGTFFDRDLTPSQFAKWFTLGLGRLSSTGAEATGIISSEFAKARGEEDWPDIHYILFSLTHFRLGAETIANAFNLKLDELKKYLKGAEGRDGMYVCVCGSRPFARGYIKLGGNSPYDRPIIEPNYLGDPEETDVKVLLEGVKKVLFLMENTTAGGVRLGARFNTNILPGCENIPYRSDAYWECFIRRYSATLHHPAGSASMGSVVDTELRVLGTKQLRVSDASIQPVIVVTNTQASTLMIAEKASDIILKYWNQQDPFYKPNEYEKPGLLGPLFGNLGKHQNHYDVNYNKIPTHSYSMGGSFSWRHKKRGFDDSSTSNSTSDNSPATPATMLSPSPRPQQAPLVRRRFKQDAYLEREVDQSPKLIEIPEKNVLSQPNLPPEALLRSVPVLKSVEEAKRQKVRPASQSKSGTYPKQNELDYRLIRNSTNIIKFRKTTMNGKQRTTTRISRTRTVK